MAHVDPDNLGWDKANVTSNNIRDLIAAAATVTNRTDFGLIWGAQEGTRRFGPLALFFQNCGSVRKGVDESRQYMSVESWGATAGIAEYGDTSRLEIETGAPGRLPTHQYMESLMIGMMPAWRILLGQDWRPQEVWFIHPQISEPAVYENAFECAVRFGKPSNAFVVPTRDMDRRVTPHDPRIKLQIASMIDEARRLSAITFLDGVRRHLRAAIPAGEVTLLELASRMGMQPSAMQSKLEGMGKTLKELVVEVRLAVIAENIRSDVSVREDLLPLLGFRDLGTLNKFMRQHAERIEAISKSSEVDLDPLTRRNSSGS